MAIAKLEMSGIPPRNIAAVSLDKRLGKKTLFDSIHQSDGVSLFDGVTVLGTVFMLLGTIYGMVLKWGPVIWAIIGLAVGAVLGYLLDYFAGRIKRKVYLPVGGRGYRAKDKTGEVILIIENKPGQVEAIEKILWECLALGVGVLGNE